MHNLLKGNKIRHRMHPKMEGNPDIILKHLKVAVFLDGCFWHHCPECYREPKSNRDYWIPKIERTVERDVENRKKLENDGWKVVRLWEHEVLGDPKKCLTKICS